MQIVEVNMQEDFKVVNKLACKIWREHYIPINGEEQVEYMLEKFLSIEAMEDSVKNDSYFYYLLKMENIPFGFIAIQIQEDKIFLSKLYIDKEERGKGYSRKALTFIENFTKEKGFHEIWLTCNKYNVNTLAVYDRLGFKIFDEAVNDIGHGYVMDDYYLHKMID